jgi:hypothetical protein
MNECVIIYPVIFLTILTTILANRVWENRRKIIGRMKFWWGRFLCKTDMHKWYLYHAVTDEKGEITSTYKCKRCRKNIEECDYIGVL